MITSLRQLLLEQLTYSINTASPLEDDATAFGVHIDTCDYDGKSYSYIVSGDKDALLRLVMHISGPSAIPQDRGQIIPTQLSSGDAWGAF